MAGLCCRWMVRREVLGGVDVRVGVGVGVDADADVEG